MEEKKEKKEFKGIWIPAEIWLCKELSLLEKVLYSEIDSLSSNTQGCFASNSYFSNFFNKSERTISIAISKLKKTQIIEEIGFNGRKRRLKSLPENIQDLQKYQGRFDENIKAGLMKTSRQHTRKHQPYNIVDNIVDNIAYDISKDMYNVFSNENTKIKNNSFKLKKGKRNPHVNLKEEIYSSKSKDEEVNISSEKQKGIKKRLELEIADIPRSAVRRPAAKLPHDTYAVIEHWNNTMLAPATKHRITPGSKTINSIKKHIRDLNQGIFFKTHKVILRDTTKQKLNGKSIISSDLIKSAIDNYALMFTEGYWPQDKSRLPRSLESALYNPYSQKSLLLDCLYNKPQLLKREIKANPVHEALLPLINRILKTKYTIEDKKIMQGIANIFKWQSKIDKKALKEFNGRKLSTDWGTPEKVIERYSLWLSETSYISSYENVFNATCKPFKEFVEYDAIQYGYEKYLMCQF